MRKITKEEVQRARGHIQRGSIDAYDCAANIGMIFANVKHTRNFLATLCFWLRGDN